MAISGWVLDKSAAVRGNDPIVSAQLTEIATALYVCPMGELEQLYSARSAWDYDRLQQELHGAFETVVAPPDIFERALRLQRDLAHRHGLWHRIPFLTSSSPRPRCTTDSASSTSTGTSTVSPRCVRSWSDDSGNRAAGARRPGHAPRPWQGGTAWALSSASG